jgi:biopolymer transport protein ExbB/TolQ
MNLLEVGLYDVAKLFLGPVLILIVIALVYSLVTLGMFAADAWQRRRGIHHSRLAEFQRKTKAGSDDLELWILHRLEWLRIVSRTSPMLGLVATMIPMGPALLALSNNDAKAIGENLVVAFSAVILALISATITFVVLTVRRRWLLQELRAIERQQEAIK